jgi:hypothetical protein
MRAAQGGGERAGGRMVHDEIPLPRGERHAQCTTPTTSTGAYSSYDRQSIISINSRGSRLYVVRRKRN